MISGFNTDIEFGGTVYHVQTEDKGLQKRVIMSLVYDKGTILASKRESYDDLDAANLDEKELKKRVGRQHKLICAAIKAGRISELKAMSGKAGAGAKVIADMVSAGIALPASSHPQIPTLSPHQTPAPLTQEIEVPTSKPPIKIALLETEPVLKVSPLTSIDGEPVIEAVRIIEDHPILSAEAVAVISELSGQERPAHSKLSVELLGDAAFKGGDRRTVNIMICRGTARKVVADAQIMIKVLGSSFRPVIFHSKTDDNGLARVHLQLPHFQAGRAALLVRAMSGGEEIELRRAVTPG